MRNHVSSTSCSSEQEVSVEHTESTADQTLVHHIIVNIWRKCNRAKGNSRRVVVEKHQIIKANIETEDEQSRNPNTKTAGSKIRSKKMIWVGECVSSGPSFWLKADQMLLGSGGILPAMCFSFNVEVCWYTGLAVYWSWSCSQPLLQWLFSEGARSTALRPSWALSAGPVAPAPRQCSLTWPWLAMLTLTSVLNYFILQYSVHCSVLGWLKASMVRNIMIKPISRIFWSTTNWHISPFMLPLF